MNAKKICFLWLFISTLWYLIPVNAQPFNFTVYREADGLPSGYVQKAFEDSRGYLWLCTYGGISRFDGREFKNYGIKDGLPGNFCDDICEDKKGNLWIGTRQGLSYFDGEKFVNYTSPDGGATSYFANCKVDALNRLSCVINGQNAVLVNGKLEYINLVKNVPGLPAKKYVVDTLADGTKIINTTEGVYSISQKKGIQKIIELGDFTTYFFFHPSEKNAFYFFNEKGIYHWQNGVLNNLSKIDFRNQIITALFVDDKKRIWLTVESKGVWIIDGTKTTFIDKNELPGYLIPSFYQDKRGTIWICTFRGLVKLNDKFVEHYTQATGLDNEDIRFAGTLANGSISMQTTIIKNGVPSSLPAVLNTQIKHENFGKYVKELQVDEKSRWWIFAYDQTINRWENNKVRNVSSQTGYATSSDNLYYSKDSTLWCGENNAVHLIKDDKIVKVITATKDRDPLNRINTIHKDYFGNVWVSERARLLLNTTAGLIDFTPKLQLQKKVFADIACSNPNGVWIKTLGLGAIHFSFSNKQWVKDKMINTDNGLPSNYIHDIETDNQQNIWIATLSGLYRFTENKSNPNTYNIRSFTKADGIDIPNWNLAFLEKDSLQNMWLGVANGIFKINTAAVCESVAAPSVIIDRVSILNNSNTEVAQANGFRTGNISNVFSYNQNNISIYYNGINLNNNFIQYTYMLKGLDKNWVTNKKSSEAVYYNLSPGSYTFMVKAINDAGLESNMVTYHFTIVPPFWQRLWFRLLMALLAVAAIYWFIKRRDAFKEKENMAALQMSNLKLTALQSQMNPHFIFNSLNSIQNYILQQKPIDAARYLSKFSKLMRRILDQSFNNLTSLNEIVETLKMYMELEAFRFSNEFSWDVKVTDPESINDVKMPPLLLQPYVENAIIHGLMPKEGEKRLLIHLYKKDNDLHCVIDDNGIGRGNKLTETNGHISRGQKLTSDMLAAMKQLLHTEAEINITDKKDELDNAIGTTVDLIIPLHSQT